MAGTQAAQFALVKTLVPHKPETQHRGALQDSPAIRFRPTGPARFTKLATGDHTTVHLADRGLGVDARLACIRQAPLFHGLSLGDCAQIACVARDQDLPRRAMLYRQGEPIRSVSLLSAGRAKVTQIGAGGEEVILWLRGAGEVLGGLGLLSGTANPATVQAIEPCHVLSWDAQTLESLSERFSVLHRNTANILLESLLRMQERFRELATEKVASRLARTLVRLLADAAPRPGDAVRIGLSREELAQMTGTTLFTVSRLLSEWKQRGILDGLREAVVVHNVQRLMELADEAAAA